MITSEGQSIVENGSYEAVVFSHIPKDGLPQAELQVPLFKGFVVKFNRINSLPLPLKMSENVMEET